MESNEQTELTSKTETDTDTGQTKSSEAGGGRVEQKRRKRTHGQQCGDCGGGVEVEEGVGR